MYPFCLGNEDVRSRPQGRPQGWGEVPGGALGVHVRVVTQTGIIDALFLVVKDTFSKTQNCTRSRLDNLSCNL